MGNILKLFKKVANKAIPFSGLVVCVATDY